MCVFFCAWSPVSLRSVFPMTRRFRERAIELNVLRVPKCTTPVDNCGATWCGTADWDLSLKGPRQTELKVSFQQLCFFTPFFKIFRVFERKFRSPIVFGRPMRLMLHGTHSSNESLILCTVSSRNCFSSVSLEVLALKFVVTYRAFFRVLSWLFICWNSCFKRCSLCHGTAWGQSSVTVVASGSEFVLYRVYPCPNNGELGQGERSHGKGAD